MLCDEIETVLLNQMKRSAISVLYVVVIARLKLFVVNVG
jgi:hypothetical protein